MTGTDGDGRKWKLLVAVYATKTRRLLVLLAKIMEWLIEEVNPWMSRGSLKWSCLVYSSKCELINQNFMNEHTEKGKYNLANKCVAVVQLFLEW